MILDFDRIAYWMFDQQMSGEEFDAMVKYVKSHNLSRNDELGWVVYHILGEDAVNEGFENIVWNEFDDGDMMEALGKEFKIRLENIKNKYGS